MTRPAWLALVVLLAASTAAAQPSSLQGRVVRWGTNDPIAKATVELRPESRLRAPYVARTSADGTFLFPSVAAGEYRVVAERPGFVRAEYAQRWPNGAGTPLAIPAGRAIGNVQIAMLQTGAIAGTVRDALGRPLGNASVEAYKATYRNGRRAFAKTQTAVADDRGEYRLFWLTPGRYFIGVRHPDTTSDPMRIGGIRVGGGGAGPNGPIGFQLFRTDGDNASAAPFPMGRQPKTLNEKFMVVYYPNTTDETAAAPIDVVPGGELHAIDFVVAPVPLHRVRGRVVYEATNEAAMSARVQWITAGGVAPDENRDGPFGPDSTVTAVECCDGAFEIGMPTGSYTIVAAVNNLSARTTVNVGDTDIDGVVLSLARGFNVTGRIIFDGHVPTLAELNAFRLSLAMDPPVSGLTPDSFSNVLPTGSFTLAAGRGDFRVAVMPLLSVAGAFRFAPMNPPPSLSGMYVKSIRLGDNDVLNGRLHLDGPVQDPLEITIGTVAGALEGRVVGQDGQPLPNVIVAVVPDLSRRNRTDLLKSTSSDASGHFRLAGLPPGDYLAFAFDGPDDGEWQNPETFGAAAAQRLAVRIAAGAAAQVELVAVPYTQ